MLYLFNFRISSNISLGVVRHVENGKELCDCIQWTSASGLRTKRYYFHTYENPKIQCIDLMNYELGGQIAR